MIKFNFPTPYLLRDDIIAGLTVGVITIPQAMAFALLAGLPPIYGLYGSFFPLVVYAFLGTSNYLNLGPVSVISIFVYTTLTPFVDPFTEDYVNAVIILGIMIGVIQCLGGLLRLGKYFDYIPKSVVSGFVQAAAVVIMISQITPAFEVVLPPSSNYFEKLLYFLNNLSEAHFMTSVFFIVSLILLFLIPRIFSSFPTAIVLLCISGILAFLFDLEQKGIRLIGEVPQGLPHIILPQWNATAFDYFPGAFGIAFVTTVGSFVMAKNVEDRQPQPWNANRDMIALWAAKIVSAFFGSLVPAGSFNRSILNIKAGAKTQISGIVAALVILFTLLFLTPIVYYLPQSVIAAIIVYSVYYLFDFPLIKHLWNNNRIQAVYLALSFSVTLIFGFVEGIAAGLITSILGNFFLKKGN